MLDAAAQLILRQATEIQANRLLVVNPAEGTIGALQHHWPERELDVWALHVRGKQGALHSVCFAAQFESPKSVNYDGVLVFLPKEKQLMAMLMANLRAVAQPGTPLWLCGHKDTGIKSQLKTEHEGWAPFYKIANGNHCQLLRTELHHACPFSLEAWLSRYQISRPEGDITVTTLPGVFSAQHLDAGTELLLDHLPPHISGHVLDFGCGAGVISAVLALHPQVTQISALDVSPLALAATQLTLAPILQREDGLPQKQLSLIGSDGLSDFNGPVDWIVTNPPFHTGKRTDYEITRDFIRKSRTILSPGGKLLLVANRFLPYREHLEAIYRHVDILAENSKFTVWSAH